MNTISQKLMIEVSQTTVQGPNKKGKLCNQDQNFILDSQTHLLMAVFDGHGPQGHLTATYTKDFFQKHSAKIIETSHFEETITELCKECHSNLKEVDCGVDGTTATLVLVNKETNHFFSATVGDSEGFFIFEQDNELKIQPLTVARNWKHAEEAHRAATFLTKAYSIPESEQDQHITKTVESILNGNQDPKTIYFPSRVAGTNTSRSLGDYSLAFNSARAQSEIPLIQSGQFLPDGISEGIFIIATDGLWDAKECGKTITAEQIGGLTMQTLAGGEAALTVSEVAPRLAQWAMNHSCDDTTVILGEVSRK